MYEGFLGASEKLAGSLRETLDGINKRQIIDYGQGNDKLENLVLNVAEALPEYLIYKYLASKAGAGGQAIGITGTAGNMHYEAGGKSRDQKEFREKNENLIAELESGISATADSMFMGFIGNMHNGVTGGLLTDMYDGVMKEIHGLYNEAANKGHEGMGKRVEYIMNNIPNRMLLNLQYLNSYMPQDRP